MWDAEKAKKTQFTTDRSESCTALISVRIPLSLKNNLKNFDDWQEVVRQALFELVEEKTSEQTVEKKSA